jgi:formylglycine-generating enzyme required for sulfatase activity
VREGAWRVGLPSELQWEKAARGGLADAVFSWGDTPDPNRANYENSEIGDSSAVGCFPANGFGLHDMIGNVWEWTRSRYGPYPYQGHDGRENPDPKDDDWLVVRGGAWHHARVNARGAYRYGYQPDARSYYLCFRVLLGSAPVP